MKRTPPGQLQPRNPLCPLCSEEVGCDGDSFTCEHCNARWPCDGSWSSDEGDWIDPDAPQCGGIKQPFLTSRYENIRHNEYRCMLDLDHKGKHRCYDIEWSRQDEHGQALDRDPWAA